MSQSFGPSAKIIWKFFKKTLKNALKNEIFSLVAYSIIFALLLGGGPK
jgi:hypothetical protein